MPKQPRATGPDRSACINIRIDRATKRRALAAAKSRNLALSSWIREVVTEATLRTAPK